MIALRALLASSHDLIYFLDADGRYQHVSLQGARALGLTPEAMIGKSWREVGLPPEREAEFAAVRAEVLAGGPSIRREIRFSLGGEERIFDFSVSPVLDGDGRAVSVMVVSRDITEQRRGEAALMDSEQSYHDLADSMPQIVWTSRADGSMDYLNKRWYDFAGLPATARVEEGWEGVIHPDEGAAMLENWNEAMAAGEPYSMEHRFFDRSSGRYRWFLSRALPIRNDKGEIVRWFGTATDIDDQKRALEELQRREERLVKTNAVIHTVGQVSQRLSAELNLDRLLQTVTDAATQLTGAQFGAFFRRSGEEPGDYSLSAISGVPPAAIDRFPMPRNKEIFAPAFGRGATFRSDDIRKDSRNGDLSPAMQAGHLPVASYLAVPVVSRSGEALGILVFGHAATGIFTEDSEQIAVGLASQAAIAVDNARLFESATRSAAEIGRGEERYRILATASAQIVWSASPAGEIVADSPSWRTVTLQTPEELLGRGWLDAVHPGDQARAWGAWTESIARSLPYQTEYRLRTRDGSYRWFATRAYPVRDPDGTIREWIGASSDIDDERRSEQAAAFLAEAAALLSSSLAYESTLRSLANLMVPRLADCCAIDMVAENDSYTRVAVAHIDPACEARCWAAQQRESPSPPHDPVAAVLKTGEVLLLENREALARMDLDGEHRRLCDDIGARSMLIVPMIARGRTLGSISLFHTASERRYSHRDLPMVRDLARSAAVAVDNARLYTEAQTANRVKDEFLATLSHELRTPMTAVLGWAQLLRIGGLDEATFREAIDTIERSSLIQAQLIDDILDVSRITAGKLRLDVGPVDLAAVMEGALDTVRQAARSKGIDLEVTLDRSVQIIQGDPNRLQQVFWNLLSNAVKFTGRSGRIGVALDRVDASARIVVSDNGRGIAPEFMPHIFEQFRQADSSTTRIFGGLGLGLAIVRQIVELHGGSVAAASAGIDRGAAFTVLLPLSLAVAEERGQEADSPAPVLDLQGLQILLVEPDVSHERLIASMLTRAGATVRVETSARNAIDGLRHRVPDVLVSSLTMPDEDGLSLIGRIRNDLRIGEERMPAVALTTFASTDDRLRILGAGFQDFVVVPVDPADLTMIVRIASGR